MAKSVKKHDCVDWAGVNWASESQKRKRRAVAAWLNEKQSTGFGAHMEKKRSLAVVKSELEYHLGSTNSNTDDVRALIEELIVKKKTGTLLDQTMIFAVRKGWADIVEALTPAFEGQVASGQAAWRQIATKCLYFAVENEDLEFVKKFAQWGDARQSARDGRTMLMNAVRVGDAEVARVLLPLSDPLAADETGNTALMVAACSQARSKSSECLALLLPVSDTLALNKKGKTALELTLEEKAWGAADLLAEWVPRLMAERAFRIAGPENMPRWRARLEAEALRQELGLPPLPAEPAMEFIVRASNAGGIASPVANSIQAVVHGAASDKQAAPQGHFQFRPADPRRTARSL